jgi:hypothetical protein
MIEFALSARGLFIRFQVGPECLVLLLILARIGPALRSRRHVPNRYRRPAPSGQCFRSKSRHQRLEIRITSHCNPIASRPLCI